MGFCIPWSSPFLYFSCSLRMKKPNNILWPLFCHSVSAVKFCRKSMKISILFGRLPGMCRVVKWRFFAWVTTYPWNHCSGSPELTIWPAEPSSEVTCHWEGKHLDRFPFPEISIRISIHNPLLISSKSDLFWDLFFGTQSGTGFEFSVKILQNTILKIL